MYLAIGLVTLLAITGGLYSILLNGNKYAVISCLRNYAYYVDNMYTVADYCKL